MTWQTTNTAKGDNKLYSDAKGVVPSLDLRFASQKNLNDYMTGTPLVDHQRSMSGSNLSPGTFVNSSGLIETAKVNLISYSEDFSFWTSYRTTVSPNAAISPSGQLNATKLNVTTDTGYHARSLPITGGTYTVSIFAKAGEYSGIQITGTNTDQDHASFNLVNGTAYYAGTNVTDEKIEDFGNGWYRCSARLPLTNGSFFVAITDGISTAWLPSFAGSSATDGIYIWGAQVEEGTTLTTYIPTTKAPSAAPRFDYDPTTGESLGLLIEESRTNLLAYSQAIGPGNDGFATDASTVTQNAAVSPDGTTTATSISGDAGFAQVSKTGLTVGVEYTLSFYVKTETVTSLRLGIVGVIGATESVTPNEWNRLSITFTTTTTFANLRFKGGTALGEPVLVWGLQFELGSFPTSYIPTTGTALTRSADEVSITGSNFSSWYNQSEGTVFVKGATNDIDGNTGWVSFYQASSPNNNRISVRQVPTIITSAGTSITLSAFSNPTPKEIQKISTAYKNDDFALYSTYSTPVLLSAGSVPVSVDTALLGGVEGTGGTFNLNGTIARLTYFPDRLEDSVLQAITQ